jgi:hypothetical protein
MTNKSWRGTDEIDVSKRLGIDKQGNKIPGKENDNEKTKSPFSVALRSCCFNRSYLSAVCG